jgi:RNA-directed DNA polymerase
MRRFILGWKQAGLEQQLGTRIVNYADDLVICCKGDSVEKALNALVHASITVEHGVT